MGGKILLYDQTTTPSSQKSYPADELADHAAEHAAMNTLAAAQSAHAAMHQQIATSAAEVAAHAASHSTMWIAPVSSPVIPSYLTATTPYDVSLARPDGGQFQFMTIPGQLAGQTAEIVHPCLVDTLSSAGAVWNGWRYWMLATPYPGSQSALENPCIFVSNDLTTWTVPTGVTNPIAPKPAGNNSDPFLFLMPDRSALAACWRDNTGGTDATQISLSTDGITWTAKQSIISGATALSLTAPSLTWTGSQWELWVTDNSSAGNPLKKSVNSSGFLFGAKSSWGAFAAPTVTIPTPEVSWWHMEVKRLPGGQYIGTAQMNNNSGGRVYLIQSNDGGTTFTFSPKPIYSSNAGYKAGMVPFIDENGTPALMVFQSVQAPFGWGIWRYPVFFDKTADDARKAQALSVVNSNYLPAGYLVADNFTRANNTTSLGSANTGQAWSAWVGSMGINTNLAYTTNAGNNGSTLDCGTSEHDVEITVPTIGTPASCYVVARWLNANEYIRFGYGNGVVQFQVISGGAVAFQKSDSYTGVANGDKFRLRCKGKEITAIYNGSVFWRANETTHGAIITTSAATKVGMQYSMIDVRISSFVAKLAS